MANGISLFSFDVNFFTYGLGSCQFSKPLNQLKYITKWDLGDVSAESGLMQRLLVYVSGSRI